MEPCSVYKYIIIMSLMDAYMYLFVVFLFQRNVTLLQLISQLNEGTASSFSRALTTPFDTIELGRLLDRGASGEVYRGVWQSNDVAIKVKN